MERLKMDLPLSEEAHEKAMTKWRNDAIEAKKLFDRPKLGQVVTIKGVAKKTSTRERPRQYARSRTTRWERHEVPMTEGVYIGWRTVCDCDFWAAGYGEDYDEEIKNFNHRHAWLVVVHEHKNPIYVFPEDVEIKAA